MISLHESLRYELDHVYNAPGVRTTLVIAGHMLTPLFSSVRHPASFLYRFFFPSLMPVDVAKSVIAALDEQHSRVLYMPFYAHFVPLLHVCPSYIRDLAQWVSSIDRACTHNAHGVPYRSLSVTTRQKISSRSLEGGPKKVRLRHRRRARKRLKRGLSEQINV